MGKKHLLKGIIIGLVLAISVSGRAQVFRVLPVYMAKDSLGLPLTTEKKGEVSLESGDASYREIIQTAAFEARKMGGNLIVPIDGRRYTFPSNRKQNFFRAQVYRIEDKDVDFRYMWRTMAIEYPLKYKGPRFEINFGLGSLPFYSTEESSSNRKSHYAGAYPASLGELYHDCYDVHISPTFSTEWAYFLNGRWSLVGSLGFNQARASFFDPHTDACLKSETAYCFDILAGLRLYHRHLSHLNIFSQLMFGAVFHTGGEYLSNNPAVKTFGWQITPIGLSYGSRVYGLMEAGWGTEYLGIRIGAGIKL